MKLLEMVVLVLRFSLVVVLYLFLWRVIKLVYLDLRQVGNKPCEAPDKGGETGPQPRVTARDGGKVAELIVLAAAAIEGPTMGALLPLGEDNYLGRNETNSIVLPDPYASGKHARIYRLGGRFWVSDLGSRNGTRLNGRPLRKPAILSNGDILKIGGVTLQFVRWENEGSGQNEYRQDTGEQ